MACHVPDVIVPMVLKLLAVVNADKVVNVLFLVATKLAAAAPGPVAVTSPVNDVIVPSNVFTCDVVKSASLAVEPVLLPFRVLAGACANFAFVLHYRQQTLINLTHIFLPFWLSAKLLFVS